MKPTKIRDEIDKTKDEIIELLWKTMLREVLPTRMPKGILKLKAKLAHLKQRLEKDKNRPLTHKEAMDIESQMGF